MFGLAQVTYSDNGGQYKSKEFTLILAKYRVKHKTHPPQANASERVSILAAIRSYVTKHNWT